MCPKDYLPSLLKWVDPENLPRYLGGTSDATLIDDAGPWNDPQIRAEIEEDIAYRDGTAGKPTIQPVIWLATEPLVTTYITLVWIQLMNSFH